MKMEFTQTHEHLKELIGYARFRHPAMRVIYLVVLVLSLVWALFEPFTAVVYLVILAALFFFMYRSSLKNTEKRQMELNGGKPLRVRQEVTEEGVSTCAYNLNEVTGEEKVISSYTVSFDVIKRAYHGKNLIILLTKSRTAYYTDKNAFTQGNPGQFLELLRSEGIKVQGKGK